MASFDFGNLPAMVPPPGHTPNFANPETMHSIVLGVAVTTITLMVISLGIRIYTKAVVLRDMRVEEYLSILATIGIIVWDALFIHVSVHGFSRHLYDVRLADVGQLSYMSYLAEIFNAPTMLAAKCSILLQLRRLFCPGPTRNAVFWAIHALIFLGAAYYTSAIFTFVFQCTPREKTWNPLMEGHCIDVAAAVVVQGAMNLFLDLGILITPLWAIWHLNLPLKQKLGISAVFGVGTLTCAIAAAGVAFRIPLLTDPDLTWLITKVGIWTMVEYCGTILVGCMLTFPRFYLHIRGRDPPSSAASGSKTSNSNAMRRIEHNNNNNNNSISMARPGHHSATQSRNKSITTVPPQTGSNPSAHSRADSADSIGVAITTSEVSLPEPAYIELEDGRRQLPRMSKDSGGTTEGDGRDDADWSPLSSPM